MTDAPIARWLRDTRERQLREDGLPWSQDDLIRRMAEEIGWAPHRPNYSKYETGRATPQPDTLAKFVRFWEARGEAGPDLTPATIEPAPDLAAAIVALTAELRAAREAREAYEIRLGAVEAELRSLRARPAGGGSPAQSVPLATTG